MSELWSHMAKVLHLANIATNIGYTGRGLRKRGIKSIFLL